jgi:hypothetical protein
MSKEEWTRVHQPYELKFHKGDNYRWSEKFMVVWSDIFGNFMGVNKDQFKDGVLLDIGCGSRPCLDWFEGGKKYNLDPLLDQYLPIKQIQKYWVDKTPDEMICSPAEEVIKALVGKCDFIVCSNVLDHTYDWREILNNMVSYGKQGSMVCFSTDLSSHGIGHPGIDDHEEFHKFMGDHYEIVKEATRKEFPEARWMREVFYVLRKK